MNSRILITDIFFPNKYAKWRLIEIQAFINKYDTDILISSRLDKFAGINFDVDYKELCESHSLDKYDFLIFNPKYNYLNQYNDPDFDGTKFNSLIKCDYMLRLKKYRHDELNFNIYMAVYHIFIMCYTSFNMMISYPYEKQFIHLYPGGGLNIKIAANLDSKVNLISTNYFITDFIKSKHPDNKYIEAFGGPYIEQNEIPKLKTKNIGTLNVCFTTLGSFQVKGGNIYQKIIYDYIEKYPNDDIKFHNAGINYNIQKSTYLGVLSQKDLDNIYQDKIDILFNLETGIELNGFPLGIEAMVKGTILFTTDFHNSNLKNGYNFDKELRIVDVNNVNDIINKLKEIYENREMLLEDSNKLQQKAFKLFGYENIMDRIFNFIVNITHFTNNSKPGYPENALGSLKYSFRDDNVCSQSLDYSRDLIKSYVNKIFNGLIVEIGVLGGATLLDLYDICKSNNNKIYGIDPFDKIKIFNGQSEEETNSNMQKAAREAYKINREKLTNIIQKYNLRDVITVLAENSGDIVSQFADNSIDLLHIDGDHSTEGVYNDLINYWPKMKKGTGILIGDDFNWKSVRDGLDKFCQEYNIEYIGYGEFKFIIHT